MIKINCPYCKHKIEINPEISDEWKVINKAIARNKGFRIHWKVCFGTFLTKAVAKLYSQRMSS